MVQDPGVFSGAINVTPPTNLHLHHSNLCRETSILGLALRGLPRAILLHYLENQFHLGRNLERKTCDLMRKLA